MSNEKSTPAKMISPSYTSSNAISPDAISPNAISPHAISPKTIFPKTISPKTISPNAIFPIAISPEYIPPNNCVQIGQACIIDPCQNYQTPIKPGYSPVSVSPQQNSNAHKSVASMLSKTIRETESKIHHQKELYEIQELTNKKINSTRKSVFENLTENFLLLVFDASSDSKRTELRMAKLVLSENKFTKDLNMKLINLSEEWKNRKEVYLIHKHQKFDVDKPEDYEDCLLWKSSREDNHKINWVDFMNTISDRLKHLHYSIKEDTNSQFHN